ESGVDVPSVMDTAETLFDVRFSAECRQFGDQIIADTRGFFAADRMRLLRDLGEMRHSSRGGKNIWRCGGIDRGWRARSIKRESAHHGEAEPEDRRCDC